MIARPAGSFRRSPCLAPCAARALAAPLLILVLSLAIPLFAVLTASAQEPRPVDVLATPILNFRIADNETRFGALRFVGGLQLESKDKEFGGFSGLRLLPGRGRFVAITDAGQWLAGDIDRDAAGLPRGLTGTAMGSLLPPDAGLIARKRDGNCEALEIEGETAWTAYELNPRIETFPLSPLGMPMTASTRQFAGLKGLRLGANKGIEALARFPEGSPFAGALLAISEETLNRERNIRAFILDGQSVRELAFLRDEDFAITDADFLPNGDLLLLQRRYSVRQGHAIKLRLVPAAELAEGATAGGTILMSADRNYWIDNLEGLDVSIDEDGAVHITLISDDNFSALQRTLLLEFVIEQ